MSKEPKIPFKQMEKIVKEFISEFKYIFKFEPIISGSYSRQESMVGDVDLIILDSQILSMKLEKLLKLGNWGISEKKMWVIYKGVRFDCYITTEKSLGAMKIYIDRGQQDNIRLRAIAKKKGYLLNQYGLFRRSNNEFLAGDESSIYLILGHK